MQFKHTTLETCHAATGTVIVIDVLRAFTTAVFAFVAGAKDIVLVSTVEEALALQEETPGALVMGEVNGLPPDEFNFGNSPTEIAKQDFSGKRLIQRTSAGTQGVVRSINADTLLVGSFVCASAIANFVRQQAPDTVTFVNTGVFKTRDGDEDIACSDYLTALISGQQPDPAPFIERVRQSTTGKMFTDPTNTKLPEADLRCATQIDRFDYVLQVRRQDDLLVLNKM